MGASQTKFLIIDDRFLLTRTIGRKFPAAAIQECSEAGAASGFIPRPMVR